LQEFEHQHKSNKFVDKRIGEHDVSLSLEEKMMKRYAVERSVSILELNLWNTKIPHAQGKLEVLTTCGCI